MKTPEELAKGIENKYSWLAYTDVFYNLFIVVVSIYSFATIKTNIRYAWLILIILGIVSALGAFQRAEVKRILKEKELNNE